MLAHQAAAWLAKDRLGRRDVEDGRKPLLDLLAEISQPSFTPRCHIISDVAMVAGGRRPWRFRAASGENWYLVRPSEAFYLVASAMEVLGRRESEFLLLLTSLPKECEPRPVDTRTLANKLHQAVDVALADVALPSKENALAVDPPQVAPDSKTEDLPSTDAPSLADASAPVDGMALARSVWQSLRTEMKGVIEARIRELSEQSLETYEEKAAVAAEVRRVCDEWGFRAIAPATGRPAYLRCRTDPDHSKGQFYFQVIRHAEPVAEPKSSVKNATAQFPNFSLTDKPVDRREA